MKIKLNAGTSGQSIIEYGLIIFLVVLILGGLLWFITTVLGSALSSGGGTVIALVAGFLVGYWLRGFRDNRQAVTK